VTVQGLGLRLQASTPQAGFKVNETAEYRISNRRMSKEGMAVYFNKKKQNLLRAQELQKENSILNPMIGYQDQINGPIFSFK